jgi:hypothetical protein
VKIVVPYAPGGPNDIVARLLAEKLTQANGQTFLVENKPGGGSNIGARSGRKGSPDGYTLLIAATSHSINMTLFPEGEPEVRPADGLRPGVAADDGPAGARHQSVRPGEEPEGVRRARQEPSRARCPSARRATAPRRTWPARC